MNTPSYLFYLFAQNVRLKYNFDDFVNSYIFPSFQEIVDKDIFPLEFFSIF